MEPRNASLDEALELLGEILESRQCPPRHLVVCGGAALRAAGIVSRVTRDVDVLAERGEVDGDLTAAWPLPEELKQAVAEVAVELKLPVDWLNASTSMLIGRLEEFTCRSVARDGSADLRRMSANQLPWPRGTHLLEDASRCSPERTTGC